MTTGREAIVIEVPEVPPEEAHAGDAESRAVAAHPAFRALLKEGRREAAAGETVAADDFFRALDAEAAADVGVTGEVR